MNRTLTDYLINNRYTRRVRISIERRAIGIKVLRKVVNWIYNTTGPAAKFAFCQRSGKIFRGYSGVFQSGEWTVTAPPFHLTFPLRKDWAWRDWGAALATFGHDPEIKDFYSKLLASDYRPDVFCDIGANYGTHSALFLSAGIKTIAFEPNPTCRSYFDDLIRLNNFEHAEWRPIALGECSGTAELTFPETETWLGTIKPSGSANPSSWVSVVTKVKRLDDEYVPPGKCFAKIDTEGLELEVIRGGQRFFTDRCDFFVFESNHDSDRKALYREVMELDFSIEVLPIGDINDFLPLDINDFTGSEMTNFLARNNKRTRTFF